MQHTLFANSRPRLQLRTLPFDLRLFMLKSTITDVSVQSCNDNAEEDDNGKQEKRGR